MSPGGGGAGSTHLLAIKKFRHGRWQNCRVSDRPPQFLWLKYGLDVKMLAVLKPEAFDWGSDKLPDAHALKYLISESSSCEEVIIKKKF